MSGSDRPNDIDFSRRTFMKGVGAAAGASVLGAGITGTAAADSGIDQRLLNWRQVEAKKVWDRGFRGRPDRTLAIADTGIEARHPDIGPWNGVTAIVDDGDLRLIDPEASDRETTKVETIETFREGTAGVGTFATGDEIPTEPFVPADAVGEDADPVELDAALHWEPFEDNTNDLELRLDRRIAENDWEEVATAATAGMPERLHGVDVDGDTTYRFVAEQYKNVQCEFRIDVTFYEETGEYVDAGDPFAFLEEGSDAPAPKTVGWYDPGARFGSWDEPRDPNSHGSHCSSIAAGSGRASTIDSDNTDVHEPHAILLPGDFIEYEVDVGADATVFASAIGENVKIEIVHDDRVVHESPLRMDSIIADEPAVHDADDPIADGDGAASYTIRVRPMETRAAAPAAEQAQNGNPTTGRLKRIAVGSYVPPAEETTGARAPGGSQAVHPGVAPDASLVGLQGFGEPTADLGEHAEAFAETFNMRAVNMSYGYPYGLPLGAFGGELDGLPAALKQIAEGGILTVAAAGNFMTPANGNGAPAGMDEPISVVATGPFDGITPYSAGGIGTVDEDENDVDRKPDVTAPGGDVDDYAVLAATGTAGLPYPVPSSYELVRAALTADPGEEFPADDPPRDYTSKGGTSMASPYVCGVSGLVAQAMEDEAPDSIALPEPAQTSFEDVMRFKQVLLATASETAFTAAPYHLGKSPSHAPTYDFGDRDPYEGYGRVNPDAAVDAVSRPLFADAGAARPLEVGDGEETSATLQEDVGLYIPEHSRAVAGHVVAKGGTLDVDVDFTRYSGGNKGMAKGDPHLDLFVYDAEETAVNGEPNIVASAQGLDGQASVSVDMAAREYEGDEPNTRTFYVVAKLVNVPGAVNGYDVKAHFDLGLSFEAADPPVEPLPSFSVEGSRLDDGQVFTAGQTNTVDLEIEAATFPENAVIEDDAIVRVKEYCEFDVDEEYGDVTSVKPEENIVHFGKFHPDELDGLSLRYFSEAPDGTGAYQFGPATVEVVDGVSGVSNDEAEFAGSEDNYVVAPDQNEPVDSTNEGASSTAEGGSSATDGGGSATDDVTDTVEDTL